MNLSNILTIMRIILVPFFIISMEFSSKDNNFSLIALIIFILAAITDFLDGFLARRLNLISNLGKFLDPLADKILTTAAFLVFLDLKLVNIWVIFITLSREFLVMLVRLMSSKSGIVIAANFWGKLKTIFQIISCIVTLIYIIHTNVILFYAYNILIYISTFLTIISGLLYLLNNKHIFKNEI